ncbi:MAG TPA: peptide deformylase, partial [Patescibacteria group bacterium]
MQSPLVYYPNELLKKRSSEVREFTSELKTLSEHMRQVMKDYAGMGLAAPQVGQSIRLITVEYQPVEGDKNPAIPFTVMINPEITKMGKETDWLSEGCLSIPYVEVDIERPTEVSVTYQDLDGTKQTIHAKGLFARIVQHEIDHLNGTLILDYEKPAEVSDKPRVIFWGSTPFSTEVMNVIRPYVTMVAI